MNLIVVSNFITEIEKTELQKYAASMPCSQIMNEHIRTVNEQTKGRSISCDMTKTKVSRNVSAFQGDATLVEQVPEIFHQIGCRIAEKIKIPAEHVFVQCISSGDGGRVAPHYDAAEEGFITYKCNVAINGPDKDIIYINGRAVEIQSKDLYCFEANLYKHWAPEAQSRTLLSYGFLLPLHILGWKSDDPRVRMSNRIWNKFSQRR